MYVQKAGRATSPTLIGEFGALVSLDTARGARCPETATLRHRRIDIPRAISTNTRGELGTATLLRRLRSPTGNSRLHRVRGKQPQVSVGAYTCVTTVLELQLGCAIRMG